MEAGVALVDIGGGTTDVCIFEDGFIRHTAIIPIAGDRITKDLQEAFGILKDQAEVVKTHYGSCYPTEAMKNEVVVVPGLPGRQPREISLYAISQVIRARVEDIISKVDFEIEVSGLRQRLAGGIVLTGGGSSMKDVTQLFNYQIGLEVHIGRPGQHLGKGMIEEVRNPMYATGIGLVMKGFELAAKTQLQLSQNEPLSNTTVGPEVSPLYDEDNSEPLPIDANPGKRQTWIQGVINWGKSMQDWVNEDFDDKMN
jgi:cell division protein FtsA